jgi:hypothetical protein
MDGPKLIQVERVMQSNGASLLQSLAHTPIQGVNARKITSFYVKEKPNLSQTNDHPSLCELWLIEIILEHVYGCLSMAVRALSAQCRELLKHDIARWFLAFTLCYRLVAFSPSSFLFLVCWTPFQAFHLL